jgi:hypothetical protein
MDLFRYFPQAGYSWSLLPGRLLKEFLDSTLEKSMRRVIARNQGFRATDAALASVGLSSKASLEKRSVGRGNATLALLAFLTALMCSASVVAQDYRGTVEERAACTPDAFRLCAAYIPNAAAVESCLRQQKFELSGACRSVFEQNGDSFASSSRIENSRTNSRIR